MANAKHIGQYILDSLHQLEQVQDPVLDIIEYATAYTRIHPQRYRGSRGVGLLIYMDPSIDLPVEFGTNRRLMPPLDYTTEEWDYIVQHRDGRGILPEGPIFPPVGCVVIRRVGTTSTIQCYRARVDVFVIRTPNT